jgi:hypothetical protein
MRTVPFRARTAAVQSDRPALPREASYAVRVSPSMKSVSRAAGTPAEKDRNATRTNSVRCYAVMGGPLCINAYAPPERQCTIGSSSTITD